LVILKLMLPVEGDEIISLGGPCYGGDARITQVIDDVLAFMKE